jgi:nitrate/TMAO reductase-like tetraheme cytochrome c subunit
LDTRKVRILKKIRKHSLAFLAGIVFAVLCFVGLNAAMEPVSKSEYCGSKCHEMKTAYQTWEVSEHGANKSGVRVECVGCHLPPKDEYFRHMAAKAYAGAKDIYKHHFGSEYDVEKIRKKVFANISSRVCLHCHNDLLVKPSSSAARIAHVASLAQPESVDHRCVKCHENAGHERQNKLFSP